MSRPDLCRDTSSLRKSLIEAMQVLDRVEHRESRAHAEKQRDLAQTRLQVENDGRALRQPRELDGAVDRHRRRARRRLWRRGRRASRTAAWRPRSRRRAAPPSAAPPRGTTPPSRATPPVAPPGFHGKNSLAPARIACRIRSGSAAPAIAKIATVGCPARRRSIAAIPDDASARMSTTTMSGPAASSRTFDFHDADRDAARAQQLRDLPLELVVVADDGCCELRHSYSTSRIAFGIEPVRAGPDRSCRGCRRSG